MSFREKSAWISFVVILVVFGAYFVSISGDLSVPENISNHVAALVGLMAVIIAVTVVEIAAHTLVALNSPADAQAARDEREKAIALRATRPAFYVLMTGVWLALGAAALGGGVWLLVQATLLAVWVAELTRFGTQIYYYRRGLA
jgi:hypothetical protein